MKKRSKEYIDRIVAMYTSGMGIKEIAKLENKVPKTIQTILKSENVELRSRKGEIRVDEEYIHQIISLYDEGKTFKEIGNMLGKSEKTISYHYKKHRGEGRPLECIAESDYSKLISLFEEGKSDDELSKIFNCSVSSIRRYRSKLDLSRISTFSSQEHKLSELQKQFIYGSLLGDMNLSNPTMNRCVNSRLTIVHSVKQEELFMEKVKLLEGFMGAYKKYTPSPDKRTNKIYETYRGSSKSHPEFTSIYNSLYKNGLKTITPEFLDKITHPIALAYWFMDDGTYGGTLSTNCFSEKEVNIVIDWLLNKWGIVATKQKNKSNFVIHISSKSRLDFETIIFPYMIPSMYYKLEYLEKFKAESV